MALARLSLLQSALLLNDTGSDDEMKHAIHTASLMANRYTKRTLESTAYTDELYSGEDALYGGNRLYLRQWPVSAVSAVKIWDTGTLTFVTETSTYYELVQSRFIEYPKLGQESSATYGCWPPFGSRNNIKVSYTAGYTTTDWDTALLTASFAVPYDLEFAVAAWAADLWLNKGGRPVASESFGPRSVTYIEKDGMTVPAHVATVLDGYAHFTF